MRKKEITDELIELSKRAKELGFPQNVESGDYVCIKFDLLGWQPQLFGGDMEIQDGQVYFYSTDEFYPEWYVILSFSRCLEWLRDKGWIVSHAHQYQYIDNKRMAVVFKTTDEQHYIRGEATTHHEAIAKAVVKILEGE